MEGGTTYHICLDIAGTLKRHGNSLRGLLSIDGKTLSGREVKAFLRNERSQKGYQFYSGCDNMNELGRCAGHKTT